MLMNGTNRRFLSPFARTSREPTTTPSICQPESIPKWKHGNQPNRRLAVTTCAVNYGWMLLLLSVVVHRIHVALSQQQQQVSVDPLHVIHQNRTVAYAISLIKCSDEDQSATPATLTDAALVLRHSIHLQSSRNPASGSKYDYKMYALVHPKAKPCSQTLQDVGFTIVEAPPPVQASELRDAHLRENIDEQWCCGSDEFIKLRALLLPEPVVVHVDIDFIFLKPMDDLYDALLYGESTPQGQAARARIPFEKKSANVTPSFPHEIQAFITRDWPQVLPGRIAGYQAGFLVARSNPRVYEDMVQTIKESNYTPGYSRKNGWGGLGYGGFVGAMVMQGFMAYYYDIVRPNTAVELNQCRYNWMGMQVKFNAGTNFKPGHPKAGQCRNDGDYCEDCRFTPVDLIYNVHFTLCRKPWLCVSLGSAGGSFEDGRKAIDTVTGDLDACLVMIRKWHDFRSDLEQKWFDLTRDELIKQGQTASYKQDLFQGHCRDDGGANYHQMQASPASFRQLSKLYK